MPKDPRLLAAVPLALILAGQQHPPVVYFARVGDGIKIGWTTNLARRMRDMYIPLTGVLAVMPGGPEVETALHEQFAAFRVSGDDGRREVFDIERQLRHLACNGASKRQLITGRRQPLAQRIERLAETADLAGTLAAVLTGVERSGQNLPAVINLQAALRTLDPSAIFDVGSRDHLHPGYRSDAAFLQDLSEAEMQTRAWQREATQLQDSITVAYDAAQAALQRAYALPVRRKRKCVGCHGIKEAAIREALADIEACDTAGKISGPLNLRLQQALEFIARVPQDLGEVHELVYEFAQRGGTLPRWTG